MRNLAFMEHVMKSVDTLIKMHNQELDEKRKELAELDDQKEQLLGFATKMQDEFEEEQKFISDNPDMTSTFDNYRRVIDERQSNIKQTIDVIDSQRVELVEQISRMFGEIKKYEIILQQKINAMARIQKSKDTNELDERSSIQFLRKDVY